MLLAQVRHLAELPLECVRLHEIDESLDAAREPLLALAHGQVDGQLVVLDGSAPSQ